MKKLLSCVLTLAMVFSLSISCFAQEVPVQNVQSLVVTTENLGNGITVETKTTVYNTYSVLSAVSTRSASQTKTYKANGATVGTATLNASFGYNGSSAWVTSKSAAHTTASGWSYGSESLTASGNTANLSALLTQRSGNIITGTVDVDVSLTCSPSGQIS